ncbi:VWA domain-containing protein, partial [Candidatus Thorarchaeota archaeon]
MDISKRIVVTFVTVALIPILVISGVSVVTIYGLSNENALDAAQALESEELANLERVTNDTALFIEERMQQYIDGVFLMEDYCEGLFNGRIAATPQYSYFWDPAEEFSHSGRTIPGRDPMVFDPIYDSYDISFDVSCYYMPPDYYDTPGDPFTWSPSTQYFIETSSNMDNVFRSLHDMSEDFIWLYMGLNVTMCDSHLFRNYPYDNLEYFLDWYMPGDYDHELEDWYQNALVAPDENVAFTSPYGDPSTGLVISMGRPVKYDNGTIYGVVSADVTLDTVLSQVTSTEILENGYVFLLGPDGDVFSHPEIVEGTESIETLEFGTETSSEATQFHALLTDTILQDGSGQVEYTKDNQRWYLTFTEVNNTGFVVASVVAASEVILPANLMLSTVLGQTLILTIALGGVLAGVAAVVTLASYRRGRAVVEPIKEMTNLVKKMTRQDFTRGVSTSGSFYEEVGTTVDALLSFQEACRYGNQAFIRGDLNRALANYQNLLEISRRLEIVEGEQTMLMNIGNVYRQRGDTGNAMDYYEEALGIAQKMLEKTKEEGLAEADAMGRIASVYHNMALVEMDRENPDRALDLLEDAAAIDMTMKNDRGLAKRNDAMGLAMMRDGRYSQAHSKFEDAKKIGERINYDRSLAYIHYHEGELYQVQGKWRKAKNEYEQAVDLGRSADELWLVVYAMQRLADVHDQLSLPSHELRADAEKLKRSIRFRKSIIFVIDYSGSMQAQNRIRAAVEGAKEIVRSQVNPQDQVSIIIFNSSYREILPLTVRGEKSEQESKIFKTLNSLKYPNYATAFYDALGAALESLDSIQSSEHRW